MSQAEKGPKSEQLVKTAKSVDPGQYQQAIDKANQHLRNDCQGRYFSIKSLATMAHDVCRESAGQPVAAPEIRPWFEVQHQGQACETLRIGDCDRLILVAGNPYSDLVVKDLRITRLVILDDDGNPVPDGPDGWPLVAAIPPEGLCFGDLPPATPMRPSTASREFTLESQRARRGNYRFDLSYTFSVEYQFQQKDRIKLSLSAS